MRFRLTTLLIVITFVGLALAIYQAYSGWEHERQQNLDLRSAFGLPDSSASFLFSPVVGDDFQSSSAWRLRLEDWQNYKIELRIHGKPNTNGAKSFEYETKGIDTTISHRLSGRRIITICDKMIPGNNGSSLSIGEVSPGYRVAMIRTDGEIDATPILFLLLGTKELLNKHHTTFKNLSTSSEIQSKCNELGVSCVTLRLVPNDNNSKETSW